MEELIREALIARKIEVVDETDPRAARLDFYLPQHDVHIEVKRFHSDRLDAQMARVPNVIAVQGEVAIRLLAKLIEGGLFNG